VVSYRLIKVFKDVLFLANPDTSGKWPFKRREREREREREFKDVLFIQTLCT